MYDRVAVFFMNHKCQPVGQDVLLVRYDDLSALADNLLHPFRLRRHPEGRQRQHPGQQRFDVLLHFLMFYQ